MKRPLEATFFKLRAMMEKLSEPSIRKRMCFKYIEWKARGIEKYKREWVDLAVEFRKAEKRIGSKRTKLEKLARRHFAQRRSFIGNAPSREAARQFALKQYAEGTGAHSPESLAKRSEMVKEHRRRLVAENRSSTTRDWVITCKGGGEFRIRNLMAFCREHNINYRNLHFTAVSNWWAKGFRARKYDDVSDSHVPSREDYEREYGRVSALVRS